MNLTKHLRKLLHVAGPAIGAAPSEFAPPAGSAGVANDLTALLRARNGFYAFEAALLVRPSGVSVVPRTIEAWNDAGLWVAAFEGLAGGALFFAEDAFGGQFCITDRGVERFDPETGERTPLASDLDGWAMELLRDHEELTGHPLARRWQELHGPLRPGTRLVPKLPFVLGGAVATENLYEADEVEGMRARAHVAVQIRDLPDGAKITLKVGD